MFQITARFFSASDLTTSLVCFWKSSGAAPVELVEVEINGSSVRLAFTRASTIALPVVVFRCNARRSTAKLRRVNLFRRCLALLASALKRLGSLAAENLASVRGVNTEVLIPRVTWCALNRFLAPVAAADFLIRAAPGLGPLNDSFAVIRLCVVLAVCTFFLITSILRRLVAREKRLTRA